MTKSMGTRAIDRLVKNLEKKTGSDFKVVAQAKLSDTSVRVVGTYEKEMPDYEALRSWAIAETEGKVMILPETIMAFNTAPYPMVAFVAVANTERIKDSKLATMEHMTMISANSYLDTDLGETWTREEGSEFFSRANPDDIEKILQGKIKFIGPKTQKCARAVLSSAADKDDYVIYVRPTNELGIGLVAAREKEGFKIKDLSSQEVHDVAVAGILHVVEGELDPAETKKVRQYLELYLGKDLAKKMTT